MATLQTTSAPSVKLERVLDSSGDPAIKTGQIDSVSRYLRKAKVVATNVGFTCTTGWITDTNLSELLTDFLPGSLIRLYYHVPTRNPSTSWGGLYIEPQVEFNESGTWNSLGCSGYDGGVMQLNHQSIASYTNTILINPEMGSVFSARFRFRFRSYDGTCGINATGGSYNMNLNVVSGTAPIAEGTNGLQHYYHIIVEEYALWSTPAAFGGTVTEVVDGDNVYRVHTFTDSGEFNVLSNVDNIDSLVVAGGGSGGWGIDSVVWGTGGGGGEVLVNSSPVSVGSYNIVVGSGGAAIGMSSSGINGNSGSVSSFNAIVAAGGLGGRGNGGDGQGGNSGSGRIGGARNGLASGGGAGDQNDGGTAPTATRGGNGGDGRDVSAIFGTLIGDDGWFGGGGAGSRGSGGDVGYVAVGGKGGGASMTMNNTTNGSPGMPGTGGGGSERTNGGGGSGIVVIRYQIG